MKTFSSDSVQKPKILNDVTLGHGSNFSPSLSQSNFNNPSSQSLNAVQKTLHSIQEINEMNQMNKQISVPSSNRKK